MDKCNTMFTSEDGKYGPVCAKCTNDECLERVKKTCPSGQIYNGFIMSC